MSMFTCVELSNMGRDFESVHSAFLRLSCALGPG